MAATLVATFWLAPASHSIGGPRKGGQTEGFIPSSKTPDALVPSEEGENPADNPVPGNRVASTRRKNGGDDVVVPKLGDKFEVSLGWEPKSRNNHPRTYKIKIYRISIGCFGAPKLKETNEFSVRSEVTITPGAGAELITVNATASSIPGTYLLYLLPTDAENRHHRRIRAYSFRYVKGRKRQL